MAETKNVKKLFKVQCRTAAPQDSIWYITALKNLKLDFSSY
jgi:hypothetical protein